MTSGYIQIKDSKEGLNRCSFPNETALNMFNWVWMGLEPNCSISSRLAPIIFLHIYLYIVFYIKDFKYTRCELLNPHIYHTKNLQSFGSSLFTNKFFLFVASILFFLFLCHKTFHQFLMTTFLAYSYPFDICSVNHVKQCQALSLIWSDHDKSK